MATALITGASRGIGAALARVFATGGADVILAARSEDGLRELADEVRETHRVKARVIPADLARPGEAQRIYDRVAATGWQVDCLVNNAGFGVYGAFAETDWMAEAAMVQVNIVALTQLTKLFLPEMIARGRGKILNVASTAAFQPGPMMAVYFATKAYVLSFSEAIAHELRGTGVSVTALCPGATETGFQRAAGAMGSRIFDSRTLPTGADVARYGYEVLQKQKRVAVHGTINKMLTFGTRLLPRRAVVAITKKLISRSE